MSIELHMPLGSGAHPCRSLQFIESLITGIVDEERILDALATAHASGDRKKTTALLDELLLLRRATHGTARTLGELQNKHA